jgi:hypothetical protein
MRKTFIALSGALLLTLTSATLAQSIGDRLEMAERRIEHGIRSGALDRREARALREEFHIVRSDEARARSDGRLDHRERARLDHELDRLERRISHLKHNDDYRGDYRGDYRNDYRSDRRDDRRPEEWDDRRGTPRRY